MSNGWLDERLMAVELVAAFRERVGELVISCALFFVFPASPTKGAIVVVFIDRRCNCVAILCWMNVCQPCAFGGRMNDEMKI